MRILGIVSWMVLFAGPAAACDWSAFARGAFAGESVAIPAHPVEMMWEMARDIELADRVVARLDTDARCHTRRWIEAVGLTEPAAKKVFPAIYIVRDLGPGPGERPPTWAELRVQGLRVLEVIAPDTDRARDVRLLRDLRRARESTTRRTPSVTGGRVILWQQWWADRGDDPALYDDPQDVPDVTDWVDGLARPGGNLAVREVLPTLVDDALRRRLLLDRIDPGRHEALVAECMHWLGASQADFEAAGFAPPRFDADVGGMVGYKATELRGMCLQLLPALTGEVASGVDEHEVITFWLAWWRRARFQARYYQDFVEVPSLAPWLEPLEGPRRLSDAQFAALLRRWYVAEGFQDLILGQLGPDHASAVAEMMEWLGRDEASAIAAGFQPAYTRRPIRPRPGVSGTVVGIPWRGVQTLLRSMLAAVTGDDGPRDLGDETLADALWQEWWRRERYDPRWYREGDAPPADARPPTFRPERARSG